MGSRAANSYSTPKDVAERLGVSLNTVYNLAQRGEIPVAFRVGPRLRFDIDAVITALEQRANQEAS